MKHHRGRYNSEKVLSDSILENNDVINKKKELDKHILNNIRLCIVSDEHQKVFSYIDLMQFTKS